MILVDLPYKKHFGVQCSCGQACVVEVTGEQAAAADKDPVLGLRALAREDQEAMVEFFDEHKEQGHTPEACLLGIAEMPKA